MDKELFAQLINVGTLSNSQSRGQNCNIKFKQLITGTIIVQSE